MTSATLADLHSFPTRRSSDLLTVQPPHRRAREVAAELLGDLPGGAQPGRARLRRPAPRHQHVGALAAADRAGDRGQGAAADRKSTRLNSSHTVTSYAVFRLKH